jgi:hypothetical protein
MRIVRLWRSSPQEGEGEREEREEAGMKEDYDLHRKMYVWEHFSSANGPLTGLLWLVDLPIGKAQEKKKLALLRILKARLLRRTCAHALVSLDFAERSVGISFTKWASS